MQSPEQLSIIMPVYNAANTIRIGIKSIIAQSFTNWRLIIIDDGSSDGSSKICDEFSSQDNRILVIHQHNMGASAARNKGLQYANGEYIAFMDADDVLTSSNLYEKIIGIMERDPTLDIVQFDTLFKYGSEEEHKRVYPFKKYTNRAEIFAAYLSEKIHVACWDKIFRKEVFNGIFFPIGQTAEDIAIIPQIIANTKSLQTIDDGYYGYTYSSVSTSNSVKSVEHVTSILKSYYIYCNAALKYPSARLLAMEVYTSQFWMYLSFIRINFPSKTKEFLKSVSVIKLPIREVLKANISKKRKFQMGVLSLSGKFGALFLQMIFTRKYKRY